MSCNATTKSGKPCGWKASSCPHHSKPKAKQAGGTIVSDAVRAIKEGPSDGPTPDFMQFLIDKGSQPILGLWVAKKPVQGYVKTMLNAASLGAVSRAQQQLGYDDIWHFYIIVVLKDSGAWVIEKNATVQFRPINPSQDMPNAVRVLIPGGQPTLYQFLKNAVDKFGNKAIWKYNAEDATCQDWLASILYANNMTVPTGFDRQNTAVLLNGLPGGVGTASKIVDAAASFDRFRKGYGVGGCACEQ